MQNKLWYNFEYTPSVDLFNERFFSDMNNRYKEMRSAAGAGWAVERPRVRVQIDLLEPGLLDGIPYGALAGMLRLVQVTPELDWFIVVPDALALRAAVRREVQSMKDADAAVFAEMISFLNSFVCSDTILLNLFLCLSVDLKGDVRAQVDSLRAIPGVRRALVINPIAGWLKTVMPLGSGYTAFPGDIDWVITFGGDLNEASLVGRMCNASRVPHFHAGFTDFQCSPWEARSFMARNELPRTIASK